MALFLCPAFAVTYLDPAMKIPEDIYDMAMKDHDVLVNVGVKDCRVFIVQAVALKKTENVEILRKFINEQGYPLHTPMAFFKEMEGRLSLKIVFAERIMKATDRLCPWLDIQDQWVIDSPHNPNKKRVSA